MLPRSAVPVLLAFTLLGSTAAGAETLKLKLMPSGGARLGGYRPSHAPLSAEKPATVTKIPEGLVAPKHASIQLGPAGHQSTYVMILDEPEGQDPRLFVDANANGDLTDDPPVKWTKKGSAERIVYIGDATVQLPLADGGTTPVQLGVYRFLGPKAPVKDALLYYGDYYFSGSLTLGGKTYPVDLRDLANRGDLRLEAGDGRYTLLLVTDLNGNGKLGEHGEAFDGAKPFNLLGTTYELKNLSASSVDLSKSSQVVEEVPVAPDLHIGGPAVRFAATTTVGKPVIFPADYRGKLVMLDFWATWCGPCVEELPGLVKAYGKYHTRGFEVLGISLDKENKKAAIATFTMQKHMPWPQIYDGKYWGARVAQLYGIEGIPAPYLVDGDTGKILAADEYLLGNRLGPTIARLLAKKHTH